MSKNKIEIKLINEDIGKLYELLSFCMEEMMSMNTINRFSKPPIFNQEQSDHLKEMMDFCAVLMKQIRHI